MQQKYAKNIHVSLRLEFFDLIGEIVKSRFPCVNTKIIHLKSAEVFWVRENSYNSDCWRNKQIIP